MENKDSNPEGFVTKQSDVNPETGGITWDVSYKANYSLLYKIFKNLNKAFKDFIADEEVRKDPKFKEIHKGFTYLWNQFKSHLRANYPKQYKQLQLMNENEIKELIRNYLKEESSTGGGEGAGHFEPGEGEQYATPNAFNPDKKADGAQDVYYYKLGWKAVNKNKLRKAAKGIEVKNLWTENQDSQSYVDSLNLQDPALKQFVSTRITDFDKIEDKLNTLLPLLKKAKTETMEYYKNNPNFDIKYGTDLASDYLDDLITLFKDKSINENPTGTL